MFQTKDQAFTTVIMTSEASSTTDSRKRKLVESEADEVFVLQKKQERTITKTVSFSIPDLLEKINDEDNKKKPIDTPKFKLGNLDFYFSFYPECGEGGVGVYIQSSNREEVTITMEIKKPTVRRGGLYFNRQIIKTNSGLGWPKFMSHDAYRKWAAENGDELKITVTVTLHLKEGSSDEKWTTLRSEMIFKNNNILTYFCTL